MSRQRFRVELLGLIEAVEFTFTLGCEHRLLWTPEGWTRSARAAGFDGPWTNTGAPGLEPASNPGRGAPHRRGLPDRPVRLPRLPGERISMSTEPTIVAEGPITYTTGTTGQTWDRAAQEWRPTAEPTWPVIAVDGFESSDPERVRWLARQLYEAANALQREVYRESTVTFVAEADAAWREVQVQRAVADGRRVEVEHYQALAERYRSELALYRPDPEAEPPAPDVPEHWWVTSPGHAGACLAVDESHPYPHGGVVLPHGKVCALPDYHVPARRTLCGKATAGPEHNRPFAREACPKCLEQVAHLLDQPSLFGEPIAGVAAG